MVTIVRSVDAILELVRFGDNILIGVDGPLGSGKTRLATQLSSSLKIPVVHLDSFVRKGSKTYTESLDLNKLSTRLGIGSKIVEGVCLQAVLRQLEQHPDLLVYVDQVSSTDNLGVSSNPLVNEVKNYTREFDPRSTSDIIYIPAMNRMPQQGSQEHVSVDIALIQSQAQIALLLAIGGILSLFVGVFVVVFGSDRQDKTLLKVAGIEISASGIGGVVMATSVAWAYFSYKSKPSYSRLSNISEEYNPDGELIRRQEHQTATMRTFKSPTGE